MDKTIDVRFTAVPQYENLGRNRYSKATGIQVSVDETHKEVHFFGLGTKGTPTAGIRLVVPLASLAHLRDALNEVLAEEAYQAARVPDAVAAAMEAW